MLNHELNHESNERADRASMLPEKLRNELAELIAHGVHPREKAVDVMFIIQKHLGYMSDAAMIEAADLLGMSPTQLEELATFYNMIFREPVGRYILQVCDSAVCWLENHQSVMDHISNRLSISPGETTADGLFTLLPVCCIGYCDHAPAMLINDRAYGDLTPDKIDRLLERYRNMAREITTEAVRTEAKERDTDPT